MTDEFALQVDDQLRKLCEITERECERLLDEMIDLVLTRPGYNWLGEGRSDVADLALEYAQRRHELDKYRALLRPAPTIVAAAR